MNPTHMSPTQKKRGAGADTPRSLPWPAWKAVIGRVWVNNGRRNLSLLSAGVAFYAFLSFVPLLGALVMSYGLIADPATVAQHMRTIIDLVPADAAQLIYDQLKQLTQAAAGQKGLGLMIALLISIYGASRASGAMIGSLNIIYEEEDRRSILRSTLLSAGLVMAAVMVGIMGLLAASMLSLAGVMVGGWGWVATAAVQVLTWITAAALCSTAIGGMYRFAPDRSDARWQWLNIGSILATLLWLAATLGFGFYASRFGDYDATYGSLGAVVVLLMWLYVSAYAVLIGGLVNAELERQTAQDTTTGPEKPMGSRGAKMADTSAAMP
ncbi:YihY/virulence factor BrkB family protein [Sphingobium sp. ZW T5_29]|uniref:YihY/virulence factor BrkB family protein n=1 Tax=Sphingobium sp. ZW T5_29 TaxID=3378077 RepID=UPI0038525F77